MTSTSLGAARLAPAPASGAALRRSCAGAPRRAPAFARAAYERDEDAGACAREARAHTQLLPCCHALPRWLARCAPAPRA
jgi:hypothetical protein